MTPEQLTAIHAREQAATTGPWKWMGHANAHSFTLRAEVGWRETVMTFCRWGLQGAEPVFTVDGILRPATEFMIKPQPHNPHVISGIDHPDAIFIEHARQDVKDLLDEVERLQEALLAVSGVTV